MKALLARNADILVTMDKDRREIKNASLYAEDGIIKQVGPASDLPQTADTVIDMSGQIVLPGFVNCHHHLNQTLTRNIPACQNNNLFPWLRGHYRIWANTTPEASRTSVIVGLAELARIVIAPCSPFSFTATLLKDSAAMARQDIVNFQV